MSANINKDLQNKRDKQVLNSYNQANAQASAGGGAVALGPNNTLNSNTLSHQSYLPGQSTLDYTMTTGRNHTNAGSFLQKLSSKFSRR